MKFLNEIIGLAPPTKTAALHCPSSFTALLAQVHSLRRIKVMTLKCVCCSLSGKRKESNTRRCPASILPFSCSPRRFLMLFLPITAPKTLPRPSPFWVLFWRSKANILWKEGKSWEDMTWASKKGGGGHFWQKNINLQHLLVWLQKEKRFMKEKRPQIWEIAGIVTVIPLASPHLRLFLFNPSPTREPMKLAQLGTILKTFGN